MAGKNEDMKARDFITQHPRCMDEVTETQLPLDGRSSGRSLEQDRATWRVADDKTRTLCVVGEATYHYPNKRHLSRR